MEEWFRNSIETNAFKYSLIYIFKFLSFELLINIDFHPFLSRSSISGFSCIKNPSIYKKKNRYVRQPPGGGGASAKNVSFFVVLR